MIRYLTAGESHGQALIGIVEGLPAGVEISASYIDHQLKRRQQGYGRGARMRIESDAVEIISGVRFGRTIGSPVALRIRNRDNDSWKRLMSVEGTEEMPDPVTIPRPGHADHAGAVKYGFEDIRNVIERASARETAMRVACATLARKFLEDVGIFIGSHIISIGGVALRDRSAVDRKISRWTKASCGAYKVTEEADRSEVRMLDASAAAKAIAEIKRIRKLGDTLGGVIEVLVTGLPIGLGSHVHYDRKLDGQLAAALMSVHAIKGVEFSDAFKLATLPGSEVHDAFRVSGAKASRRSNRAGGVEGGMTNGEMVVLQAAMKPISTLAKPLPSVDMATGKPSRGRYERSDVCAVPAASIICEAVIAPVLANAFFEKYGGDSMAEVNRRYSREDRRERRAVPRNRRNS